MTIEEYNKEVSNLSAPAEITDPFARSDWYRERVDALKQQLSEVDLNIVIENERNFYRRMSSSVG